MESQFTKEEELLSMVEDIQTNHRLYWNLKAKYGNATQQLEICKKKERDLRKYCKERREQITNIKAGNGTQKSLF